MDISSIKPDNQLDARGLSCPIPILKTRKALNGMNPGEILEVWSTDHGSKNDLPAFCRSSGNEFLGMEDVGQEYTRYFIKRG